MASEILQEEWRLSEDRSSGQPSDLVANLTGSRKCRVLLVEDNLINQRVLAKQLRKLGYVVYTENHGEEALTILRSSTWWQGPLHQQVRICQWYP
jgi:PleD family two-component response regulator